ncbi:MAG: serine protease, partial [Spirochaetaceae bacterium]|nr:serine protease [Spirochaetaceae bacterium]
MKRNLLNSMIVILFLFAAAGAFGQTNLIREYVGLINQTYYPEAVDYIVKLKEDMIKKGMASDTAEFFDDYLKGSFGSGFVYVGDDGSNYIITNYHVIARAHTISITFENREGEKTVYEQLRLIAADEDIDLAVLAFRDDAKPFNSGLVFMTEHVEEGSDVFAAGFPGLGNEAIWQFSRGMISNAAVRFPPEKDVSQNEVRLGPFIQHTAQVDPGNSGGPLLVRQPEAAVGYVVAGINTLSARRRQAANFAIPADRALAFIQTAINGSDPAVKREKLDAKVESFISGLDAPRAVFPHIAAYLSNHCIAVNAEYAVSEVMDRTSATV